MLFLFINNPYHNSILGPGDNISFIIPIIFPFFIISIVALFVNIINDFYRYRTNWIVRQWQDNKMSVFIFISTSLKLLLIILFIHVLPAYYKNCFDVKALEFKKYLSGQAPIKDGVWSIGNSYIVYCKDSMIQMEIIHKAYYPPGPKLIYKHNNLLVDSLEAIEAHGKVDIYYFKPNTLNLNLIRVGRIDEALEISGDLIDSTKSEISLDASKQIMIYTCPGYEDRKRPYYCNRRYYSIKSYNNNTTNEMLDKDQPIREALIFDLVLDSIVNEKF